MNNSLVEEIFEKEKKYLLRGLESQKQPLAYILGGLPASGKSNLASIVIDKNPTKNFLIVNGDIYIEFHPHYSELKKLPNLFSAETQIFSNVFTEALIQKAIENKYNIIIEGTMRNPQIPLKTAKLFQENGFKVEALAISAPAIFTELGLFVRYQEEINFQGWGRLAEMESHNNAVNGLPKALDLLYDEKAVEKKYLYNYQAKKHIESFILENDKWNLKMKPSEYVEITREVKLK